MCVKRCQNIFYWVKKRLVWVVLDRGERDKNNETGLKEGGGIQILTTVLHSRCSLLRFEYLPSIVGSSTSSRNIHIAVSHLNGNGFDLLPFQARFASLTADFNKSFCKDIKRLFWRLDECLLLPKPS